MAEMLNDEQWERPLEESIKVCAIDNPECEACQ